MFEQWPRLEGLFALSQAHGLDVRPTLLRVLTDLFVDAGHRSETEIARYAELATHLVEQVDEETRFIVAGKLAPLAHAPREVVDKLIASEPEAAGEIIAASPLLGLEDLWTLAADGGPMTCAAIARRRDLDGELTRFLARKAYPLVAETLILNVKAPLDRETLSHLAPALNEAPELAERAAARKDIHPLWLAPLFLVLGESARLRVLEASRQDGKARHTTTREGLISLPPRILESLEFAALSRRVADLAKGIAAILDVEDEVAGQLVGDATGQALALTLVAIGMPSDQAARVIMFANQAAGESVERMRSLSLLMDLMPRHAAVRLVRAMTAMPSAAPAGRHEPVFTESVPARPLPATTRRPSTQAEREAGRKPGG